MACKAVILVFEDGRLQLRDAAIAGVARARPGQGAEGVTVKHGITDRGG